jgi:hypothetical protein
MLTHQQTLLDRRWTGNKLMQSRKTLLITTVSTQRIPYFALSSSRMLPSVMLHALGVTRGARVVMRGQIVGLVAVIC